MKYNQESSDRYERLRRQAEELLGKKGEGNFKIPDEKLELIQELMIHHAELEIQNEELRRAQEEITNLQREYEDLYEFAPCGYVTLSPKGIITRINLTGVTLLCVERKRLLHRGFSNYVAQRCQASFWNALKKTEKTKEKKTQYLKLNREDGSNLWALTEIQSEWDNNGNLRQYRVMFMDIA